jgi:hypothetical protein
MKTRITHSSHNHVCTWQKLDRMRIPETGTQHSDNSRWCGWLGACYMNVRVWFQCTIVHKQQHSSHLLQEWPPQATPHIPIYDECSNENWLLFEARTPHQIYVLCPMEHMFTAIWTLSTTILQAPIHDLWIEWKKVLSSFVSQKKEKKRVLSKYYRLFHITGETL